YYNKSLKIYKEIGDKLGISASLNNIGYGYNKQGDTLKALEYYNKSLKISEEIGDKQGVSMSLNNIGNIYFSQNDYLNARIFNKRALKIAQSVNAASKIANAAKSLSEVSKKLGKHKEALDMYKLYIATRDSIESEENQKEVIRQELKYNYEKK